MKLLHFFIFFCALGLCWSSVSRADTSIEGRILHIQSEVFIHINPGNQLLPLRVGNSSDRKAVQQLESGDFITGQGVIKNKEAHLHHLYFVGLQKLLGLWRTSTWEFFEFRSYENLRLYWSTSGSAKYGPLQTKTYSYNLAPSPDAKHWSMLLVDSDTVDLARLKLEDGKVYMQMLDRYNGSVKASIQLTPIALEAPSR